MGPFQYMEPSTIQEAISLMSEYGDKAKVLAGGTDLIVMMKEKKLRPEYVIYIGNIDDLEFISLESDKSLRIGSLTTINKIENSKEIQQNYQIIAEAASNLGTIAIRNIATIGGNICNAAPSADMIPSLIALGGKVNLISANGERTVTVDKLFLGPSHTVIKSNELLKDINIPKMLGHSAGVYLKHRTSGNSSTSVVGVAVLLSLGSKKDFCEDVKIVLGAVGPKAMRVKKAESILKGQKIDSSLVKAAAQAASEKSKPLADFRSSIEYRKEMVRVITKDAIKQAIIRAKLTFN